MLQNVQKEPSPISQNEIKKGKPMELKTNYQYTYFIHPFIIKERKISKILTKNVK